MSQAGQPPLQRAAVTELCEELITALFKQIVLHVMLPCVLQSLCQAY